MTVIDVHTHFIPAFAVEEAASRGVMGVRSEDDWFVHPQGFRYPVGPEYHDPAEILSAMDRRGIDVSVLSIVPPFFFYEHPADENVAKQLARQLKDKLVVVHASADLMEAAAVRWRAQLAENAKVLAFHSLYPELNHNEVVAWGSHKSLAAQSHVVTLRDRDDHPGIDARIEVTTAMLTKSGVRTSQVWSGSGTPLSRVLSLIHLGDYVSVYLAVLRRVDPTPVVAIDLLKRKLAERAAEEVSR